MTQAVREDKLADFDDSAACHGHFSGKFLFLMIFLLTGCS